MEKLNPCEKELLKSALKGFSSVSEAVDKTGDAFMLICVILAAGMVFHRRDMVASIGWTRFNLAFSLLIVAGLLGVLEKFKFLHVSIMRKGIAEIEACGKTGESISIEKLKREMLKHVPLLQRLLIKRKVKTSSDDPLMDMYRRAAKVFWWQTATLALAFLVLVMFFLTAGKQF